MLIMSMNMAHRTGAIYEQTVRVGKHRLVT